MNLSPKVPQIGKKQRPPERGEKAASNSARAAYRLTPCEVFLNQMWNCWVHKSNSGYLGKPAGGLKKIDVVELCLLYPAIKIFYF